MIEGRDIVCLSFVTWDDHWGTPQQFMSRLARSNRVLFVDQPISPFSFLTGVRNRSAVARQFKRWRSGPREVVHNVWAAAPPPILPFRYHAVANGLNARILRRWLSRQSAALGFSDPIFWNFQPSLPSIGRAVQPAFTVYHCVDDFASVPHWWNGGASVRAREETCCREADLIVCTGRKLVESRRQYNSNIHFVPEAADIDSFMAASSPETVVPKEIADLPGKVIGYIGVIDFRFDSALLAHLAIARPEWSFALVGPVKGDARGLDEIRALPNVHFFGRKPLEVLPAYVKGMDVCTIPYVLNDYTHHVFPLKLYEYLAAGKPMVVTDMFELRPFEGNELAIARTPEEFLAAVDDALATDSPARVAARQRTAMGETWEDRIEQTCRHMERTLSTEYRQRTAEPEETSPAEALAGRS